MVFRALYDELTWNSRFDELHRYGMAYRSINNIWSRRLVEKILYWKTYGKKFRKTPEESFDKAVLEYCEEFRKENEDKPWKLRNLHWMAKTLQDMDRGRSGTFSQSGEYLEPAAYLTPAWQKHIEYEDDPNFWKEEEEDEDWLLDDD